MRATDWIGWAATALFLASYSRKDQRQLRLSQAAAALLWVGYGAILHAVPIVVANLLVAAVAVYSTASHRSRPASEPDRSRTSSPCS
jgi:CHASE2 domain-containing sensor protein